MNIVLIVEDEKALSEALSKKLKSKGYNVLVGENGQEGKDLALSNKPDCIILDIVMPRMDGITMLKEIRKDNWGKTVPVIILTNMPTDDTIHKAIVETEPSYYFEKTNISLGEVAQKIDELISANKTED